MGEQNPSWVNPCGIRDSHPRAILGSDDACWVPDQNIHPWVEIFLSTWINSQKILLIPHCCLTLQNTIPHGLLWEKSQSYIIKIQLWRHTLTYSKIDFNFFLWKHIDFMFYSMFMEKIKPSGVFPCGIRKSHALEWIFQGLGKPCPWPKYSPLGWNFLIPNGLTHDGFY